MPEPLQTPASVTVSPEIRKRVAADLRRVSVVRIACAKAAACCDVRPSLAAAPTMPCSILGIGSNLPMIPVEEGRICEDWQPATSAARRHMVMASRNPRGPVQALALPELTTIPRSFPAAMCVRPTWTAGETTLLVVNTAAAVAGMSHKSSATSA